MKKIVVSILSVLFLSIVIVPINVFAADDKELYYNFACEGIEKYYQNKDLNSDNDISKYFNEDALMLLDAKIEMETFQRQVYDLSYNNYEISIIPFDEDNWYNNDTEMCFTVQIVRTWYYSSEPTTMSEVLNVCVSGESSDSYIVTSCYDKYESLTYGPIDEMYQSDLLSRGVSNSKEMLDDYVADFKAQCISKEE